MKKLNVYYAQVENMGDKLNEYLMQNLFGYEIVRHTPLTCELSGIGSGLGQFTYSSKIWLACAEAVTGKIWKNSYVWGTGFIEHRKFAPFYRKLEFCAVRGELSRKKAELLTGHSIQTVLGDGGILTECAVGKDISKRYAVGIIAHYKEREHLVFQKLAARFPHSIVINVRNEPEIVARRIAECECILSSSLHGLILADSFYIPNLHIKVSDALLGDGFKFDDYYSSYGLPHKMVDLQNEDIKSLNKVYDLYQITTDMVNKQKRDMFEAFPFK